MSALRWIWTVAFVATGCVADSYEYDDEQECISCPMPWSFGVRWQFETVAGGVLPCPADVTEIAISVSTSSGPVAKTASCAGGGMVLEYEGSEHNDFRADALRADGSVYASTNRHVSSVTNPRFVVDGGHLRASWVLTTDCGTAAADSIRLVATPAGGGTPTQVVVDCIDYSARVALAPGDYDAALTGTIDGIDVQAPARRVTINAPNVVTSIDVTLAP